MLKLFQDFKTKLVIIYVLSNIKLIDLFKLLNLKIKNPEIIKSKNFSNKKKLILNKTLERRYILYTFRYLDFLFHFICVIK